MGIFSRGPKLPLMDKLFAKAERAGVNVTGAVAVSHEYRDGRDSYLVVFPDRVDVHHGRKVGALSASGMGVESYPLASVSSVSAVVKGIWMELKLTGSGFDVSFRGDQATIPLVRDAIMKARSVL